MQTITDKLDRLLNADDLTHCFADPDGDNIMDMVHPGTGRTVCYGKTLAEAQAENPKVVKLLLTDWMARKAARQNAPWTWEPSDADDYDYGLEVLPPIAWRDGAFCVGEPWDHRADTGEPRYQAHRRQGDVYFRSSRPVTVRELAASLTSAAGRVA